MEPYLLPYKYKALKFSEQYSKKAIVDLGWKARKYIKWSEVHGGNDRQLLKEFGRSAVEDEVIDENLFPQINQILLNVQYWRLDREGWAIEPEHEKAWDKARDLILASNENPKIILSYLSDYFDGIISIDDAQLHTAFINVLLLDLVLEVKKIPDFRVTECEAIHLRDVLLACRRKGYFFSEFDDFSQEQIITMLDLPMPIVSAHLTKDAFETNKSFQIVVVEQKLSETKFIKVDVVREIVTVTLNINNECVRFIKKNRELKQFFIKFITSYAKTIIDNPSMSNTIDDFNAYLAMNLNRDFKAFSEEGEVD